MVIGVPCLNRPELLSRFLASVDEPWPVLVIDNSGGSSIAEAAADFDVMVVQPPANLGVAGSWNLVIRSFPDEPWWCIANADTELASGDLARLAAEMALPGPRWVGMNGDWRVMGLSREAVELVGLFDENFHPIYCEDADYEHRCTLAGVPWYFVPGGARHEGSASIAEPRFAAANARTYPANVAYYRAKWGGPVRRPAFSSPFDRGGSVRDWTLDPGRVVELAW